APESSKPVSREASHHTAAMYLKFILAFTMSAILAYVTLSPNDLIASGGNPIAAPVTAIPTVESIADSGIIEAEPDPGKLAGMPTPIGMTVETAAARLGAQMPQQSHPEALGYAFRAYFNYKAAYPSEVRNPYLYFVDFGLDSETPRGYVFDMNALTIVEGPFNVAHGNGSVS